MNLDTDGSSQKSAAERFSLGISNCAIVLALAFRPEQLSGAGIDVEFCENVFFNTENAYLRSTLWFSKLFDMSTAQQLLNHATLCTKSQAMSIQDHPAQRPWAVLFALSKSVPNAMQARIFLFNRPRPDSPATPGSSSI